MNISIAAEALFYWGTFPVTNTLLVALAISLLLISIAFLGTRRLREVPHGLQNVLEAILEGMFDFITSVTHDREKSKNFFPIVATIFIFVLASNLVEVVPGLGTIGIWEEHGGRQILVPFLRSSSADLNVTIAIALVAVASLQVMGIATIGFVKYASKFFNFKNPILFFVGILELVSEVAKVISFSFRLFGNIFAGEVLLTVVLFLLPWFAPLPFLFLELFVGFVQALVFSMLTLVFLTMATVEAEH
ncbi:MAG: F0F1 ATP synthase subunit A [Patescibacteria group bacterium]